MKGLAIALLGVAIWGVSLLWPEVNGVLTVPVMTGIVAGLGAALVLAALVSRLNRRPQVDMMMRTTIPVPVTRHAASR
jgi:hypothetical protein